MAAHTYTTFRRARWATVSCAVETQSTEAVNSIPLSYPLVEGAMSSPTYPWQQAVTSALAASPDVLPVKINLAEKAIAARQIEMPQPDVYERLAITEALRCLRKLIDETRLASPRTHFHIRWSSGKLDWERFSTTLEAEANAQQLARPGETYTLEDYGDNCPRCGALILQKANIA